MSNKTILFSPFFPLTTHEIIDLNEILTLPTLRPGILLATNIRKR